MKVLGIFILYVSLVEFLPLNCQAKHHKGDKHHATSHKHHNSTPKITSTGVPGALKNVILHKTSNRQNNGTLTAGKTTGQAMGRDILVHNANTGVGHVVKGSTDGHAPVIVINSDAAGGKSGSLDPFSQDCLDAHNNYRARHGVPPLIWSHELAEGAQAWADQLASTDSLQHDQVAIHNHKIGENLAYFQPAVPKCEGAMVDNCVNCREMIQRWYNEAKNYDYDKGGPKMLTSPYKHFTQLIWANTAEVGVGTAISKRYGFITVARYRPTGNNGDLQEFISNVPPEGGPLPTVSPHADSINPNQGSNTTAAHSSSATSIDSETPLEPEAAPSTTITVKEMPSASATPNSNTSSVTCNSSSPAKSTDMAATVENDDATGNKLSQPEPGKKGAQTKGGFVHTLTANDGTKAQVYLSRNGAHAGIVFRDQISRAPVEDEKKTSGIKRTINVL